MKIGIVVFNVVFLRGNLLSNKLSLVQVNCKHQRCWNTKTGRGPKLYLFPLFIFLCQQLLNDNASFLESNLSTTYSTWSSICLFMNLFVCLQIHEFDHCRRAGSVDEPGESWPDVKSLALTEQDNTVHLHCFWVDWALSPLSFCRVKAKGCQRGWVMCTSLLCCLLWPHTSV